MPTIDVAKQANLDRLACPVVTTTPELLARQGIRDVQQLTHDVRDIDPTEVWGRLARWYNDDPERLFMALITLAVYAPSEAALALPDWVTALDGGLMALIPTTRVPSQNRGTMP